MLKSSLNLAPSRELLTLARVVQWNGGDELEIVNRGQLFKKFCWEGLEVEVNLRWRDLCCIFHFCFCLFFCLYVWAKLLQSCWALCDHMDGNPPGSSAHGNSPGKNIGVGCLALLQGIFPTQGLNLHLLWLLHCGWILYHWASREALFHLWELPSFANSKVYCLHIERMLIWICRGKPYC